MVLLMKNLKIYNLNPNIMNSFEDKNLKRIADALERLIPSPINLQNLNSSNLFVWKTNQIN